MKSFRLPLINQLRERLLEKNALIQVILGPRQVGKTSAVDTFLSEWKGESHYATADDRLSLGRDWIEMQWQTATQKGIDTVIVLDEIQKISEWSEVVKKLWDRQCRRGYRGARVRLVLLGSSSLELQTGLTESLTGRFELIRAFHWTYWESRQAFGYDLDRYLSYGGYPGADAFTKHYDRWLGYVRNSIVETVIGKDILHLRQVRSPALFRQAFEILCHYPAQEVSFTKLLGQLQDKGNTDLIKHYIELYEGAFLFRALSKYGASGLRKKTSSPKILPLCPALHSMTQAEGFVREPEKKGRVFELSVGADLARLPGELMYWREGDFEIDFVYSHLGHTWAIEVKSGRRRRQGGMAEFRKRFPQAAAVFIEPDHYLEFSKAPGLFLDRIRVSSG